MEENLPKVFVEWSAPEFVHKERKVDWFWAVGIIGIAGAVVAFLSNNFLFSIFILFATGIVIVLRSRPSEHVRCKITEDGIYIGTKLYPFEDITEFWIEESEPHHSLLFHTGKSLTSVLSVHFDGNELMEKIYEAIPDYIPENHLVEPLSNQIMNKLGF